MKSRTPRVAPKRAAAPPAANPWLWPVLISAGLVLGSFLLFGEVLDHPFSDFDDSLYLTSNTTVQEGLTWSGVRYAFTTLSISYWQPLTFLSHMLGWELFGERPGGHHLLNLLLHMASAILTFLALWRLTGAMWRSAAVAALFAFHPLHVETVAWLANRQDALASVGWLLALLAYAGYARQPSAPRYLAVAGAYALALMSKPAVVVLPAILLILDYWPLGRSGWKRLALEKAPLAAMSIPVMIAAYVAERTTGATELVKNLTGWDKFANLVVSYSSYLVQTVWPASLAVIYPYERNLPVWWVAGALLLLAAVGWAASRARYATAGLLWFFIGLLPTAGLVQVGFQARADRYTYIPLTGLFVAIVWKVAEVEWLRKWAALALVPLAVAASMQVRLWRDSYSLFEHTRAVTGENAVAENNLGHALSEAKRYSEAIPHYREAIRINPACAECYYNLGVAYFQTGRYQDALPQFETALKVKPDYGGAGYSRGRTLAKLERPQEALAAFLAALELPQPPVQRADTHNEAGLLLANSGRWAEALPHFQQAVRLDSRNKEGRRNLATTLYQLKRPAEAAEQLKTLLSIYPGDADARQKLEALQPR